MIDSPGSHGSDRRRSAALWITAIALCACAGPKAPVPEGALLDPLTPLAARLPDAVDHAALELAATVLVSSHEEAAIALAEFEEALDEDRYRGRAQRDGTQLLAEERAGESLRPFAIDVANAALPTDSAYRVASKKLLKRSDLNPAHRTRLEESVADDPVALARARIRDHRESLWAQTFNAASRPLGNTLITGLALAPYSLAQSVVHFFAGLNERPSMSVQERQALAHWKRHLDIEPDAPDADRTRAKIAAAEGKLDRLLAERYGGAAEASLDAHQPRRAFVLAERALVHSPGDHGLERMVERARTAIETEHANLARSLEAPPSLAPAGAEQHALAIALLVDRDVSREHEAAGVASEPTRGAALARAARRALRSRDERQRDFGELALATVQLERGRSEASFARLDALARKGPEESSLARHAAVLVVDPFQNPYEHFRREAARASNRRAAFRVLGPWSRGPRYRSLPPGFAYLIDAPALVQAVITAPLRVLLENWEPQPDFRRPAALAAYRTLARFPDGEHHRELLAWLYQYESSRKHHAAALRIADFIPGFDPEERQELAEVVAGERLQAAARIERPDLRGSLLQGLVREFPETQAGRDAGEAARKQALDRSPQRIRLTRGFLEENVSVAGPSGLGLHYALLDGDLRNGELHPGGVTLRGGREIEIALLAESGDEEEEAVTRRVRISPERLARTVAQLDEAAIVGAQIDRDDEFGADASRDRYFERARLGLTGTPDERATARSTYVYRGLRERFGLVRSRESILPFDLVLQGSLVDLSLGAYPRWREPEKTPDAFLYR